MMHAPLSPQDHKSKEAQKQYLRRRFCQRVYKPMGGIAALLITILLGVIGGLAILPTDTSWRKLLIFSFVMAHPLLVGGLVAGWILLFVIFWRGSREVPQVGDREPWLAGLPKLKHIISGIASRKVPQVGDRDYWLEQLGNRYQEQIKEARRGQDQWRQLPLRCMNKPDSVIKPSVKDVREYASDISLMEDILKDAAKGLLVLGEAGTGKSTLLLELALERTNLAQQNTAVPLPLILPLARWDIEQFPLEEWIYVQSWASYKLSVEELQPFIQNKQLILLLDGFDEVAESKQAACIQAINTYCKETEKRKVPMIVTSRTKEYMSASGKLDLRQAIEILPLERKDVEASFAEDDSHLESLLKEYQSNVHLQELATTPLFVNILRTICWDKRVNPQSFAGLKKTELQWKVLDEYVNYMLTRPHHLRELPYSPEQAKIWLSWLAYQIQLRWPPIFSLKLLDPDWLSLSYQKSYTRSRKRLGKWSGMLLWGLLAFLLQVSAPLRPLLPLLVVGALFCFWPYLRLFSGWTEERSQAEKQTLEYALRQSEEWDLKDRLDPPSQKAAKSRHLARAERLARVSQSAKIWMICEMVSGPLLGLASGLVFGWLGGLPLGLNAAFVIWVIAWLLSLPLLLKNMVVKHSMVRFWLQRSGVFPWYAVSLLEEARIRCLLQREGKNYRFIHLLVLDYFVDVAHRKHADILIQNEASWNQWRQQNPATPVDLRGANLRKILLRGVDLHGVDLSQADLSKAVLATTNFNEADLSGANLSNCELRMTTFRGANLTKACLKFACLYFGTTCGVDLREANLSQADLREADLEKADLCRANLSQANLRGANLRHAYLQGANLSGTRPELARSLDKTDLRGVTGLTKEQLEACKAKGAMI